MGSDGEGIQRDDMEAVRGAAFAVSEYLEGREMSTRRNLYEANYRRIETLLGRDLAGLRTEDHFRLPAGTGIMDLVLEVLLPCPETGGTVISLAHYFTLNGDLCEDPEMTVRLFPPGSTAFREMVPSTAPEYGRAEATSFQQAVPPIYQVVYPEPGKFNPRLRRDLNQFLGQWLRNVHAQGHRLVQDELTDQI